jgi:hypothetical protein
MPDSCDISIFSKCTCFANFSYINKFSVTKYLTAVVGSAAPSRTYSKQVQARWHIFVRNSYIRLTVFLWCNTGSESDLPIEKAQNH